MKIRVYLLLMVNLLALSATIAQDKTSWRNLRSSFSFNAGLTIPIVCFGSDDISDNNSAFAKPGFIAEINYKYRFTTNIGVGSSLYWATNPVRTGTVSADGKYSYFGLLAGPVFFKNLSTRWEGDVHLYGGVSNAYMPRLNHGDKTLLNKESAYAFTWAAGASVRYNFSGNSFVSFNASQVNLKPQFESSSVKTEQHIVGLNFAAGLGVKW